MMGGLVLLMLFLSCCFSDDPDCLLKGIWIFVGSFMLGQILF